MATTVACVVGTRPEAVKMAPVVRRLRRPGSGFDVLVLSTGQHRELLDRALADFGIRVDDDLALMRPGQDLAALTARCLEGLGNWIGRHRPDLVVAQGDTTSVFAAALACHYRRVPFAHVEAGLRSGRLSEPFPEEANRALTARLADLHFAPTAASRENLLREGIPAGRIRVVGNTVIDALRWIESRPAPLPVRPRTRRMILMTSHRRENHGEPLRRACRAVRTLLDRDPGLCVVFPVHPSPSVREIVDRELAGLDRVQRIDPVGYPEFVSLMKASALILSDSGGVQEEAPALGRPVLVLRDRTERPEGVAMGSCRLVGTDPARIVAEAEAILLGTSPPRQPLRRRPGRRPHRPRPGRALRPRRPRPGPVARRLTPEASDAWCRTRDRRRFHSSSDDFKQIGSILDRPAIRRRTSTGAFKQPFLAARLGDPPPPR